MNKLEEDLTIVLEAAECEADTLLGIDDLDSRKRLLVAIYRLKKYADFIMFYDKIYEPASELDLAECTECLKSFEVSRMEGNKIEGFVCKDCCQKLRDESRSDAKHLNDEYTSR